MGRRHDGNDPVTLTETWCPRARVQRPHHDCVALVMPSGASIEALYHIVRVGTSDVPGPVSAPEPSRAQGGCVWRPTPCERTRNPKGSGVVVGRRRLPSRSALDRGAETTLDTVKTI